MRKRLLSKRVSKLLDSRVVYPLGKPACELKLARIIDLKSNESPFVPSQRVLWAIRLEAKKLNRYPDPEASELKRAIASYVGVKVNCVTVGNGSDELVDLICKTFMDADEQALIPIPTFAIYEIACRANGGVPRFFKLPRFEWPANELSRAFEGARVAFVARPNSPTGNSLSADGLRKLLETRKLVVVDEAYAEFAGYSVVGWVKKFDNLIVLRTFSKAFGLAGLRIGYAICSPELSEALERVRAPFNVNRLAQAAALAALRDKAYLRKVVNTVRKGRTYIRRELSKLGLRVLPSDANFLMVDVTPLGADAPSLCEFLAERGILIRDLSRFRGAGSRWVRITVGTPRENELLISAIKQFEGGG
jgi:histidinol-phosphate aminotransferase